MKNVNQNKKMAKLLVVSMFAVGVVTPLMFSNISEAANFGKGGAVAITTDAEIIAGNGTKWAKSHKYKTTTPSASNSVVITDKDGGTHLFKIVAASGSGTSATLTLWSYDDTFGYTAFGSNNTYVGSELEKKTDALYDSTVFDTYERAGILSNLNLVKLETSTGKDPEITNKYVWIPSKTEVEGWTDSEEDGKSQRAVSIGSWLRSPYPDVDGYTFGLHGRGYFIDFDINSPSCLRPALQILNQSSSWVFTANKEISTGEFATDGDTGTPTSYALNSSAVKPTFSTATDGVILDDTKIGVTTKDSTTVDYVTTGLLTTNSGITWEAINTGDNANIAYMAQVSSGQLDLKNVAVGTDYNLKIFGLKTADTTVTQLADNAVNGLSKGADGKIHMKVSGTVNEGVPVTVSNGAVVDFGGGDLTAKLDLKSGGNLAINGQMNFGINGVVEQAAGSNITVDASKIQADNNDPAKAMFTGVDSTDDLKVVSGNLTIDGQVTDGQYYVLVAGDAVEYGDLTAAYLWKMENIVLDTSKYFLADYDYVTNGNAIAVKVQAATVEEVNTSGLAAVQQGNITVAKEFTGEVENHLGMIANPKLAEKEKYDKEIWASYIRTKETTDGMKLGAGIEGNNTAQYNGAVVGVDFYSSRKAVTGVAISYTTGDIDSQSNGTFTRNKSKYYGVSFYDRVTNGNTALIYDIGYIRGDNDINQYYNGRDTTADVKTDTYTAGVRYEAEFGTEKSRVVPFASFRYMRQNNKDYTNSHNTRFETKYQNIYIPKVGIAWTGDFSAPNSVCTWRPSVEVGYLWNLGDRSADSNVFMGAGVAGVEYDTVDKSSYYARAGLEFMSKNFTAGVFYRYLKGNAVKNNKWNVNMSWKF